MTVPVPGSLVYTYSADDSTTSFPYPVRFLDKAEIVVILREGVTDTVQVLGTDYTISGSSWPTGGSIVFGTAPASGKTVVIYRNTVAKQLVDLENTQRNDANAVETQLDRLAMVQQDHGRKFEGTWQTRPGETAGTIQSVDDGHILVSDGNGNLVDGGAKSDLASAEQGELADTAVQPGDAEALPTDGTVGQILVRDPDAAAGRKWSSVAAGVGDMLSTAYDPAGKGEQVLTVTDAPSDPDLSNDTDKLALRGDVKTYADTKSTFVADRTALAGTGAVLGGSVFVQSAQDQSLWQWDASDLSAEVAADKAGIFVPPTGGDGSTGAFVMAGAVPTGGFFPDDPGSSGDLPRIVPISDRVFIGRASGFSGKFGATDNPMGFARWGLRDQTFIVGAVHGRGAIMAWSRASDGLGTYDFADVGSENPGYGLSSFVYNDTLIATREARMWAIYAEARHMDGASATYMAELEVVEYQSGINPAYPTNIGGAKALGVVIASGGAAATVNPGLGTPQTAAFALAIGNNTADFDKGLIFEDTAIKLNGGLGKAIAFYTGHMMEWYNATNEVVGRIYSAGTTSAQLATIHLANNQVIFEASQGSVARFLSSTAGTAPATFLDVTAGVAGSDYVSLAPNTTQTNADLRLGRAGTGRIDIRYDGAAASTPANFSALFYLPMKINGTLRYIPYSNVVW